MGEGQCGRDEPRFIGPGYRQTKRQQSPDADEQGCCGQKRGDPYKPAKGRTTVR